MLWFWNELDWNIADLLYFEQSNRQFIKHRLFLFWWGTLRLQRCCHTEWHCCDFFNLGDAPCSFPKMFQWKMICFVFSFNSNCTNSTQMSSLGPARPRNRPSGRRSWPFCTYWAVYVSCIYLVYFVALPWDRSKTRQLQLGTTSCLWPEPWHRRLDRRESEDQHCPRAHQPRNFSKPK